MEYNRTSQSYGPAASCFPTLILFGAAERGEVSHGQLITSPLELFYLFGNPPEETLGLFAAIQALGYSQSLIYFRVSEEGFSSEEYIQGLTALRRLLFLIDHSPLGPTTPSAIKELSLQEETPSNNPNPEGIGKGVEELQMGALFLPGVGDTAIINQAVDLCIDYQGIWIATEQDLFDFLTAA